MQNDTHRVGTVFRVSVVLSAIFVAWGALFTENLAGVFQTVLDYVINTFGSVYLLAVTGFLIFMLYLGFSRYGRGGAGRERSGEAGQVVFSTGRPLPARRAGR